MSTQSRRICRLCGALLTDTATPCWCWYCHQFVSAEEIINERPRPSTSPPTETIASWSHSAEPSSSTKLPRIVQFIDSWCGVDKALSPASLRDKQNYYLTVFVLILAMSLCFIGASWSDGDLWRATAGVWLAYMAVFVFAFKWNQLKRIPIDVGAEAPPHAKVQAANTNRITDPITLIGRLIKVLAVGVLYMLVIVVYAFILAGVVGLLVFGIRQMF